jgi:prevent-host-death family protein
MNWHLQDAKNNFSKLVRQARENGPQTVTLRGDRAVVVLSAEDYDKLAAKKTTLIDTLLEGPVFSDEFAELVNQRSKTPSRLDAFDVSS